MSIYDHVWLGSNVYIEPEFGYENVALVIWYRNPGGAFTRAWDPNGGYASPTVSLAAWEEIQRAVNEDRCTTNEAVDAG